MIYEPFHGVDDSVLAGSKSKSWCLKCHEDKQVHGVGMEELACLNCHTDRTQDLKPGRKKCLFCHGGDKIRQELIADNSIDVRHYKLVAFLIGMIVCYQILFTDISNNLLPFATLKAMGYRTGSLVKLVLEQATFLALLGFVLGLIGAWFLYWVMESQTGLTMALTPLRIATILLLTLTMCLVAGLMAIGGVMQRPDNTSSPLG